MNTGIKSWADCSPVERANRLALIAQTFADEYPGLFNWATAEAYLADPDNFRCRWEQDTALVQASFAA